MDGGSNPEGAGFSLKDLFGVDKKPDQPTVPKPPAIPVLPEIQTLIDQSPSSNAPAPSEAEQRQALSRAIETGQYNNSRVVEADPQAGTMRVETPSGAQVNLGVGVRPGQEVNLFGTAPDVVEIPDVYAMRLDLLEGRGRVDAGGLNGLLGDIIKDGTLTTSQKKELIGSIQVSVSLHNAADDLGTSMSENDPKKRQEALDGYKKAVKDWGGKTEALKRFQGFEEAVEEIKKSHSYYETKNGKPTSAASADQKIVKAAVLAACGGNEATADLALSLGSKYVRAIENNVAQERGFSKPPIRWNEHGAAIGKFLLDILQALFGIKNPFGGK